MALLDYIGDSSNNFSLTEQLGLTNWYQEFAGDPALQLIQRNLDRECDRNDIEHSIYIDFLKEVSWCYRSNQPNPTDFMDTAYHLSPSKYLLPGKPLPTTNRTLVRYMRSDHLVKYNLQKAAIPITYDMQGVMNALRSGTLDGLALIGSILGRQNSPVWVSPKEEVNPSAGADHVRDLMGLQHIAHGHLIEISYPQHILPGGDSDLRAPTILDAISNGAENWVFVKRGRSGGPDWGHTANLRLSCLGVKEAVHSPFRITSMIARQIKLHLVGVIQSSPCTVDYQTLFNNT